MNTQTDQPSPAHFLLPRNDPDQDEAALLEIAGNPSIRYKKQAQLAARGSLKVKCALAINPSLLPAIQTIFAEGSIAEIREALASNPKLDPACQLLLLRFSKELKFSRIQTLVTLASNPSLTEKVMHRITQYVDVEVIAALATNPSLPESIMLLLSNTKISEILAGLAANPNLPEYLRTKLMERGYKEFLKYDEND